MDNISFLIKLYKSELLYDVRNKLYLAARSRTGEPAPAVFIYPDNEGAEANDLARSFTEACHNIRALLYEYGLNTMHLLGESSNILSPIKDVAYIISLSLPANFATDVLPAIAATAHAYVVNFATSVYLLKAYKADAADYANQAAANLQLLTQLAATRRMPTRNNPQLNHSFTRFVFQEQLANRNEGYLFTITGNYIWTGSAPLVKKGFFTKDQNNIVIRLNNNAITAQNYAYPTPHSPRQVTVTITARPADSGTLHVSFYGYIPDPYTLDSSLNASQKLEKDTQYKTYVFEGKWNGTGQLQIAYTSLIYISNIEVQVQQ